MSVNKVILVGHVGADPEVRYLEKGVCVARLRMATTERGYTAANGTEVPDRTEWHNVVLWRGLAEIAEKYGDGKLICTSRLAVEIPGISFENIPLAEELAQSNGLYFGGTGNKIRPVASCKGSTCVYGNFDTHALATKIHNEYYINWHDVNLPHKFKIAVGGCPNSCMKPSINDFGVEGHKVPVIAAEKCRGCKVCAIEKSCPMKAAHLKNGKIEIDSSLCLSCGVCTGKCPFGAISAESKTMYQIYVGGTWGKRTRMGTPLSRLVKQDEVLPILEKTLLWFKENAYAKERLGLAIDRVGVENLEKSLFSDDLINRKEDILRKEILTR